MKNCYFNYSKSNMSHYFTWDDISFRIGHFDLDQMNDKLCGLKWHYILKDEQDPVECRDLLSGLEKSRR